MNNLTMKHLRYFDALARFRHFGRAAEACAITQPALSLQIKELETLVGTPLVERTARQVHLTALGEDFATWARDILLSVDELGDMVRAAQGPLHGRFRIGLIPTVAPYLLPEMIKGLRERFPSLDILPREAVTMKLIEDLLASHLDAAIVALPISEPALQEFALFDEAFVLVRPPEDADRPVPSVEMLQEMRLLLLEEGHCFRDQALSFCEATLAKPRHLMEGSSLTTLVQMVGAGIGVTLIPEMALPVETRSANVSLAQFPEPRPSRTIGMVWRKTTPMVEQLKQIAAIVRIIGTMGRDGPRSADLAAAL